MQACIQRCLGNLMLDEVGSLVVISTDRQQFGIRFASLCKVRSARVGLDKDGKLP